jgi:gliding motility-associated protein GldL
MSKRGGIKELFFSSIMPKVYGIGAAVVILGAMFKLLHYPGAEVMLGIGLSTEAIIFFLSAFEPKKNEPEWSKVYPELGEDYEGAVGARSLKGRSQESVSKKLDTMLESAKIGPELVDSLGRGMRHLSETTSRLGKMGDAAIVTNEYSSSVRAAASNINKMNQSYADSVGSMVEMASVSKRATAEMANATKDSKEYHNQVQSVTKNLGALNAVYEMELQDTNQHIKAMNKFYTNLTQSLESMTKASKDAENFNGEINKLTTNLSKLNNIYGGMITAMKGSQA